MRLEKTKTIALDLNDTLDTLVVNWINRYNELYNDTLNVESIKGWDICNYTKCGSAIYDILDEPGFFTTLGVRSGSQSVVRWLSHYYSLIVVTAYRPSATDEIPSKIKWLNKHFSFIPDDSIIFCNSKYNIKADYLLDDGIHNLESFDGTPLLMDMPHNRHTRKFVRMNNWDDVFRYFKNLIDTQ